MGAISAVCLLVAVAFMDAPPRTRGMCGRRGREWPELAGANRDLA
jgi:hypothetical protein